MYAIIKTGGKQYRVKEGDILDIEKLSQEKQGEVTFDQVLFYHSGNAVKVGSPLVPGMTVKGEILDLVKDKKVITYKYKKRKNTRRRKGHRQPLSRVKIISIQGAR